MTLSVIIPSWSATDRLVEFALKLAIQVKLMCDELIITEDGEYNKKLEEIADKYLIHPRLGHAKNLAEGIKVATGDFVALIDSDMDVQSGDLRKLCIPGRVVSPSSVQRRFNEVAGWFIVCPREFVTEFLPYDHPSQGLREGIDTWVREFHAIHEHDFEPSDQIFVVHGHGQSYGRFLSRLREEKVEVDKNLREIAPDRHKARLLEDPEYAAKWGVKE